MIRLPAFVRQTLKPAAYHGHEKEPPFFEGWYFKLVDASGQHRYAVIPGIFLSDDPTRHHAFVQVLDGVTGRSTYHTYPPENFWTAEDTFDIRLGPNHFTSESLRLEIAAPERVVSGTLRLSGLTPWPVSVSSPGIMGWYACVPFMECYHGVVSLDHSIAGTLTIDGRPLDFTAGRGYTEKDWGRSFPEAWVWFQTNHFEQPGISLTASIAIIPWVRQAFPGFIIGLWYEGSLYRLATYTGARIEVLDITGEEVMWVVRDGQYRLEMLAQRAAGGLIRAPTVTDMGRRIAETLDARVEVRLSTTDGGREIYGGTGCYAGLEVSGDLDRLVGMLRSLTPFNRTQHRRHGYTPCQTSRPRSPVARPVGYCGLG